MSPAGDVHRRGSAGRIEKVAVIGGRRVESLRNKIHRLRLGGQVAMGNLKRKHLLRGGVQELRTIGNVVQIGRDNKDSQDQRNPPRAFEKTGQNEATAGFVKPLQEYRNALAETFALMSMAMRFNEEETQ